MSNGTTTVRNTKVLPQKVKNGITIDLAIPLLGIFLEKIIIPKHPCTPIFIVAVLNIQDMKATKIAIDR